MKNVLPVRSFGRVIAVCSLALVAACGTSGNKKRSPGGSETKAETNTSDIYREGLRKAHDRVGEAALKSKKMCNGTIWGQAQYVQVPGTQLCIDIVSGRYFDGTTDVIDPAKGYLQCTRYRNLDCGGLEASLTTCANFGGGKACFEELHPYIKRVICTYRLDTTGMCASL